METRSKIKLENEKYMQTYAMETGDKRQAQSHTGFAFHSFPVQTNKGNTQCVYLSASKNQSVSR